MYIKRKNRLHTKYEEVRLVTCYDNADKHELCSLYETDKRKNYDRSKNFLYVMDAFSSRVDEFSGAGDTPPDNVTVPYWIAEAIASGFRMYKKNLLDGVRQDLTLDWCFGVTADKKNEYDLFTITAGKVLVDAYNLMWLFGITRQSAIEIAYTMIAIDYDGEARFVCTLDSIIDMAKRTSKNELPSYHEWKQQKGCVGISPHKELRDSYFRVVMAQTTKGLDGSPSPATQLKTAMAKKRQV